MYAINLHLLWLMSNTTHIPTLSEFFQVPLTSPKCFQSVDMFLTTLYQTERDAAHPGCTLPASRIFFRLITRTTNLRILRRLRQGSRTHTISFKHRNLASNPLPRMANPTKLDCTILKVGATMPSSPECPPE